MVIDLAYFEGGKQQFGLPIVRIKIIFGLENIINKHSKANRILGLWRKIVRSIYNLTPIE
jgi:hypothetical protein